MDSSGRVLVINKSDTVAVALADLPAGTDLRLNAGNGTVGVTTTQPIPFGHKVALRRMGRGDAVIKYGEVIGLAARDILPGEHVHTHNVESQRGRGDLVSKKRTGGGR